MVRKQYLDNKSMANIGKIKGYHMVQKWGRTKKVIKVGKIIKNMTS